MLKWVRVLDFEVAVYRYKFYSRLYIIEQIESAYKLHICYVGDYVSDVKSSTRNNIEEIKFLAKLDAKVIDFAIKDREALDELYSS